MKKGKKTFQLTEGTIGSETQPMVLKSCLNEYVISMERHLRSGLFDQLPHNLQLPRKSDSYSDIDIVNFLYAFFCAQVPGGLKGFYEYCKHVGEPLQKQLAAVCGRDKWPSSSSVSRYLSCAETEIVRKFSRWLLIKSCLDGSLLSKDGAACWDTKGNPLHFLDFDYQILAIRHRKLVDSDEYPPPKCLPQQVAAPGYAGRKRGEKQISRGLLSHAGSGLWLGCWASPGNGDICDAIRETVHVICDLFSQQKIPLSQAVMRLDNAGGHPRCLSIIEQAGIQYLVRLALYKLFDDPDIQQALNDATWQEVPSSGSGPKRFAAELGNIRLPMAQAIVDSKLEPIKPVVSRVVVSRYQAQKKRGVGVLIDGWVYELFGTSLSWKAWPAAELVSNYFSRAGKENRIAQQDRELYLNRLYCHNLPGLELVNTIGMWVQNTRTQFGFILQGETLPTLAKEPRHIAIASTGEIEQTTNQSEQNGSAPVPESVSHCPSVPAAKGLSTIHPKESDGSHEHQGSGHTNVSEQKTLPHASQNNGKDAPCEPGVSKKSLKTDPTEAASSGEIPPAPSVLQAILAKLPWPQILDTRPGFKWDPVSCLLTCMCGVILSFYRIRLRRGKWSILFRAPYIHCSRCHQRSLCSSSKNKNFQKELGIPIPDQVALELLEFSGSNQDTTLINEIITNPPHYLPPKRGDPGQWAIRPSTIIATQLRRTFMRECGKVDVFFEIIRPPQPSDNLLTAGDIIQKRLRRRKSWEDRHKNNQLPDNVTVHVRVANTTHLDRLFQVEEKQAKVA
jgi:hypothetical protein